MIFIKQFFKTRPANVLIFLDGVGKDLVFYHTIFIEEIWCLTFVLTTLIAMGIQNDPIDEIGIFRKDSAP